MSHEKQSQTALKKWMSIVLIVLCVAISWMGTIDAKVEDYVDDAIIQATVAYGSARALNAAISVAQSTQVGVSFGGEAGFRPLEVLDPVNDMVEDYATVMKYAIGSLITQKLLIEILATNAIKWIFSGIGVLLVIGFFFFSGQYIALIFKGFLFIALVRFVFVVTILLASLVDSSFLDQKTGEQMDLVDQATKAVGFESRLYKSNLSSEEKMSMTQQIQELQSEHEQLTEIIKDQAEQVSAAKEQVEQNRAFLEGIESEKNVIERLNIFSKDTEIEVAKTKLNESAATYKELITAQKELIRYLENLQSSELKLQESLEGDSGFFSSMKDRINSAQSLFSTQKIKQLLEESIEAMLNLIALFMLKTLIMPVVFLFLVVRVFRWVWGVDLRTLLERRSCQRAEKPL